MLVKMIHFYVLINLGVHIQQGAKSLLECPETFGCPKQYFCIYFNALIPTYVEPGPVVSDLGHPWYQLSFSFLRTDHAPGDQTPDDDR